MKINGSIDPKSSLFIPLVTLQRQNQYPSEMADITAVPVNSDIPELCARGTEIYYQVRFFSTCIDFPEVPVNFYLSVAKQVTFVSQNCSVNVPRLGELEGLACICERGMKHRKVKKCWLFFFFSSSGLFGFLKHSTFYILLMLTNKTFHSAY